MEFRILDEKIAAKPIPPVTDNTAAVTRGCIRDGRGLWRNEGEEGGLQDGRQRNSVPR